MAELDPAWLEELSEFVRIESVSADADRAGEVGRAAEWVRDFLRRAGGEAELVETPTFPLVAGEVRASGRANAPTVLVYGHFDVQPPGPPAEWDSPPFEATIRDGWLYGRGTADDKGQLYTLLKAAELLAQAGELPVNLRFACDGEEETGGEEIVRYIEADERGADAAVIFDGAMLRPGAPVFYTATRGLLYLHLRVRTGERDLHSGVFGGAALNAMHALMQTLQGVLPGDDGLPPEPLRAAVVRPTDDELAAWGELEPGSQLLAEGGARPADTRAADDFYLRTWAQPAVDVNGIAGGEAHLQKTVLPVEAEANVSIRLAPGQDADEIAEIMERLLNDAAPAGLELEISRWAKSEGALVSPDAPALRLAQDAFERVIGTRPVLIRVGGTLPIVVPLVAKGIPLVLTGFDVPDGNIHSPNERLLVEHIPLAVDAAREVFRGFANLPAGG